jgi:large subunit ribosomal protein L30
VKGKRVRVRQVRSAYGWKRDQQATLRGLGLGRPGASADLEDTPAVRGMIQKVVHLVAVEEAL